MKIATSHRAILSTRRFAGSPIHRLLFLSVTLALLTSVIRASLVTGNVVDLGLGALQTKISFYPTNLVQVTPGGLSAGPPITITATNGAFSQVLDAGDYVVSFPLVPWRKAFTISVPAGQTNNITNWISSAIGPYTNTLADDAGRTILFNP